MMAIYIMNEKKGMITIDRIKNKLMENKTYCILFAVLLILGLVAWNVYGSGLHDNRAGTDEIRTDLQSVKQQQSTAIDAITNVESGLGDSAGSAGRLSDQVGAVAEGLEGTADTIADAQERIGASQGIAADSTSLLSECQSILRSIRKRGQGGTNET